MTSTNTLWGYLAEFDTPEALVDAADKTRLAGYVDINAYSPFPIKDISPALGQKPTKIQWLILLGGLTGGIGGFFMQWYANVISFPWNVGGRPLNSWPSWMPVTFELTVLCAAGAAVVSLFALCGLPQPYHPVFNVPAFKAASNDKFFLCIQAKDAKFSESQTREFLKALKPQGIYEVDA